MRNGKKVAVFAGSMLLLAVAGESCSQRPPKPVVPPMRSPSPPAEAVVKVVPTDTAFTVELATDLSSNKVVPGEPLRARVVTPLEATDGDTIVPFDATIVGNVVGVSGPAVLVRFDAIQTRWGPRAVRATFARSQPVTSVIGERPQFEGYDGALKPVGGIPLAGEPPVPGAPEPSVAPLDLPPGARLQLVLTDAIAVRTLETPPTAVTPEY